MNALWPIAGSVLNPKACGKCPLNTCSLWGSKRSQKRVIYFQDHNPEKYHQATTEPHRSFSSTICSSSAECMLGGASMWFLRHRYIKGSSIGFPQLKTKEQDMNLLMLILLFSLSFSKQGIFFNKSGSWLPYCYYHSHSLFLVLCLRAKMVRFSTSVWFRRGLCISQTWIGLEQCYWLTSFNANPTLVKSQIRIYARGVSFLFF